MQYISCTFMADRRWVILFVILLHWACCSGPIPLLTGEVHWYHCIKVNLARISQIFPAAERRHSSTQH